MRSASHDRAGVVVPAEAFRAVDTSGSAPLRWVLFYSVTVFIDAPPLNEI